MPYNISQIEKREESTGLGPGELRGVKFDTYSGNFRKTSDEPYSSKDIR